MLGDIIYETKVGKLIGTRLISVEEGIPKIEVTISQEGTLRTGKDASNLVTFWSESAKGRFNLCAGTRCVDVEG
jgi:hypothetical protein